MCRPELALAQYLRPTTPQEEGGTHERGEDPPWARTVPTTPLPWKRVGGGNGKAFWPKETLGLEIGNPEINQGNVFVFTFEKVWPERGLKKNMKKTCDVQGDDQMVPNMKPTRK